MFNEKHSGGISNKFIFSQESTLKEATTFKLMIISCYTHVTLLPICINICLGNRNAI